jgi:hypothetical protein
MRRQLRGGGRIEALPGLCTLGYRARTRAARAFKLLPCWLDEKSNGRTTPQYECLFMRRSRKYNVYATEGVSVGQAAMGETHEIARVDLPPICAQPKGKLLSATIFKRSQLTQTWSKLFQKRTDRRVF